MRSVAFVTASDSPEITDDDRLAVACLQTQGVSVQGIPWDRPGVDWSRFDGIILRSPWNYYLTPDLFADWLRARAADGSPLWNSAPIVLENMNKSYLQTLAGRGVEIVPSEYLLAGETRSLHRLLLSRQWDAAIVKPSISAGAHDTWRTSLSQADRDQDRFEQQCRRGETIVQPFLPEIMADGEWSLIFFDGEFSHAVVKRPASGDFRVQHLHGGTYSPECPAPELIAQAQSILSKVSAPLLYARVDGVIQKGRFLLMELEINEPFLFLGTSPSAAERFASAIMTRFFGQNSE